MTQYKKYLEDSYTKATIDIYFKDITIFNNFLKGREINRSIIDEFKIYLMEKKKSIYWIQK
ncbi:MAG: hypothetical protein WBG30_14450 [Psychrilyobacter sp.]|uniref:hypothetical protein n=1 Tax=Psychrilyobacter sp. TaxID=2586924 RepID=UPI003C7274F1